MQVFHKDLMFCEIMCSDLHLLMFAFICDVWHCVCHPCFVDLQWVGPPIEFSMRQEIKEEEPFHVSCLQVSVIAVGHNKT